MMDGIYMENNSEVLGKLQGQFSSASLDRAYSIMQIAAGSAFRKQQKALLTEHGIENLGQIGSDEASKIALTTENLQSLRASALKILPEHIKTFAGGDEALAGLITKVIDRIGEEGQDALFREVLPEEIGHWCLMPE